MSKVVIIPAILAVSEEEYGVKLKEIEESDLFKDGWVQIDFMDNKFVQNEQSSFATQSKSINPEIIVKYKTSLKIEAHLMVNTPSELIDELSSAGVKRVVGHIEVGEDEARRFIEKAKEMSLEVGLAINPETSIELIKPFIRDISVVLVMSVHPGFQGQEFITKTISKIKEIARLRLENNLNFIIEVDGGIDDDVVKDLMEAGADNLVIGSHLLQGNLQENLEKIQGVING